MIVSMKVIKLSLVLTWLSVRVSSWKTCDQTFCGRVRRSPQGYPRYSLDLTNLTISPVVVEGTLITDSPSKNQKFTLQVLLETAFTMIIGEERERLPKVFSHQHQSLPLTVLERTDNTITFKNANTKAVIYGKPFKVEFYSYDNLVSVINSRDRLVLEHGNDTLTAIDVSFIGAQHAYGIPLHAEQLSLQNTGPGGLDPYRLYNVHNENYTIKSTEALHGAIPVLYGHGTKQSSGVLWASTAETWVDVSTSPNQVDAFFMSETSGDFRYMNLIVYTGPTLAEAAQQHSMVFGRAIIPQYFTLGYHQSRQSYMTQNEVLDVVEEFDKHDLPLDAVWLDIDYTDNKKMFTWDPIRFPEPLELQAQLAVTNRKLMTVIDPHIKAEKGYFVHDEATAKGYYIRNPNGTDYLGLGHPGLSGYFDFVNSEAMSYYVKLHGIDTFKGRNIYTWSDMNQPVVFDNMEHENTIPGDLLHVNDLKHRDLHNQYGSAQVLATYFAHMNSKYNLRPFTLTRSHFLTIQLTAAVWTGDNYASWEHLKISFPMCLAEALAGASFCGANIGGFNGIPNNELFQRWYQAGAWLPLYRGHSAKDVPRREPYLYSDEIQSRVRSALNQRYAHLPVWYTLFWEYFRAGDPVIRPLTYHYPNEVDAMNIDNEILVGADILAAPILSQGAFIVSVYLPGGESEIWYNTDDNNKVMAGTGYQLLYVNISSVPVFYRGGSIIPRKDIPRQSTVETHGDPYTLYICLDKNNEAKGTLYVDDYESFNFITYQYLYLGFSFVNNAFSAYKIDPNANYDGAARIGQLIILRPPRNIAGARLIGNKNKNSEELKITYTEDKATLILNNLKVNLQEPFKIELYE